MRPPSNGLGRAEVTPATEGYLKVIRRVRNDANLVSIERLCGRARCFRAIRDEHHRGVVLTVDGERIAVAVERRNANISRYLVEVVGVPGEVVDAEAEHLAHHISPERETRLAAALPPGPSP